MPVLYRVVKNSPPQDWDFLSQRASNFPTPVNDDVAIALWVGVSTFDSEERARNKAIAIPRLGGFIAELAIPDPPALPYARTLMSTGHHTVWARPEYLHACVRSVVTV